MTDPAELDVDHVVPLENANASGGSLWTPAKKQAFANDLEHPEALMAGYRADRAASFLVDRVLRRE